MLRRPSRTPRMSRSLEELRDSLKDRSFRRLLVRQRMIPKAGGKLRRLGIATVTDRVVSGIVETGVGADFRGGFPAVFPRVPAGFARIGGLMMRWLRCVSWRPTPMSGSSRARSRPASMRSHIPLFWIGRGIGSGTSGSGAWSRRSLRRASSVRTASCGRTTPVPHRGRSSRRCSVTWLSRSGTSTSPMSREAPPPRPINVLSTSYQRTRRRSGGLPNYRVIRSADDCVPDDFGHPGRHRKGGRGRPVHDAIAVVSEEKTLCRRMDTGPRDRAAAIRPRRRPVPTITCRSTDGRVVVA